MEECIDLLCSNQKLKRDKGIAVLEQLLPTIKSDESIVDLIHKLIDLSSDPDTKPWETLHGSLLGLKCIFENVNCKDVIFIKFCNVIQKISLDLLTHNEVRVRLAAGEALGSLCKQFGSKIYISSKEAVLTLIEENLEREFPADLTGKDAVHDNPLYKLRRSSSSEIFHDTAGWKSLETSMKCLQFMVNGCGSYFQEMIDQELLDLIFTALKHSNRFVRETGYYVFGSLVACFSNAELADDSENNSQILLKYGQQLSHHLGVGLADNWSQVRLAASEATRKFLLSIPPSVNRNEYLHHLLPRMCLNRYYVAEGVRIYSQESWKLVTGTEGKELVEMFIDPVVKFYVAQTKADNHAVREAACACIAELGAKIRKETVEPHVSQLLEALLICFQDDSWPVRDAACLACGNFVMCFPKHSRSSITQLYHFFFENLQDNIGSVRQGAAASLANVARAYGDESLPILREKLTSGLKGVKDQSAESYKCDDSTSNLSQFGVIKHLRDNDIALHTNQPMFSCGSLAPKMGRGGGCMDHQFRRPSEPWELADGCTNLLSELSSVDCGKSLVTELMPLLSEAVSHKHYSHHVLLLETLCKQLSLIAKGLGKRIFKQHLECFLSAIFYSLQVDNALTKTAAENCLCELSTFLGPGILRGRVEYHNPSNLHLLDKIVALNAN